MLQENVITKNESEDKQLLVELSGDYSWMFHSDAEGLRTELNCALDCFEESDPLKVHIRDVYEIAIAVECYFEMMIGNPEEYLQLHSLQRGLSATIREIDKALDHLRSAIDVGVENDEVNCFLIYSDFNKMKSCIQQWIDKLKN